MVITVAFLFFMLNLFDLIFLNVKEMYRVRFIFFFGSMFYHCATQTVSCSCLRFPIFSSSSLRQANIVDKPHNSDDWDVYRVQVPVAMTCLATF